MKYLKDIKVIVTLIVFLVSATISVSFYVFSAGAETAEAIRRVEVVETRVDKSEESQRKHALSWAQFKNTLRIKYTEGMIKADRDNPYWIRKTEDLEKQNRCLEEAKQIPGKQPIECMEDL